MNVSRYSTRKPNSVCVFVNWKCMKWIFNYTYWESQRSNLQRDNRCKNRLKDQFNCKCTWYVLKISEKYWHMTSSSVFFLKDDMIPDMCNIWLPVPALGTKTQDTLYQLLLLNYWLWEIWCYDEKFSYNYAHKLRTAYEADAHRQLTLLADIWKCCKQTFSNESVS